MKEKKKIYIILSYTGTLFSVFLRHVLQSRYVHVSIGLDSSFNKVYSFGRKRPEAMFPCGFVNENIKQISHVFKNAQCQIFELEIEKEQFEKLEETLNVFICHEEEYGYNICGLIPMKLNIAWMRKRHYVCSQFVGKVIQEAGIYDLHKNYSLVRPLDIKKIDRLKKIYEGNLSSIPYILS